jgi:hypothetical protein
MAGRRNPCSTSELKRQVRRAGETVVLPLSYVGNCETQGKTPVLPLGQIGLQLGSSLTTDRSFHNLPKIFKH